MEEQAVKAKKGKREFVGIVKSDKMEKTIVVEVQNITLHALYKKYINRTKKLKAHDENNKAKIGDKVRVEECRPISKDKCWRLVEVIERAK